MRARVFTAWMLACLISGAARGQGTEATQGDFHGRVASVYNFSPHMISPSQQKEKAAQMDAFWKDVKADPAGMLPQLRAELKNPQTPRFFKYDGSALLLSMSHSPDDEKLIADTLPATDLADVVPLAYFNMVHKLSVDGMDATQAALHLLDDGNFQVVLPQHAMTLKRPMALVFLLLPMPEENWADALVTEFNKAKKDETKTTLLTAMFFAQTPQTDAVIAGAAQGGQSTAVQAEARRWLQTIADARQTKYKVKGKEPEIREARRAAAATVSDEALSDISAMTGRLVQVRK
ncbi:HAP2/GCS1 family protein [Terriglobus tenax]|uniref:HAP2/GCS1 family protein n=1 Tax=Terriglobus tenax TaxID=1111115 RepID=UPI0021E02A3F|nr:HAP2/GCS1 family protein [Terriglobus tenax]